MERDFSIFTSWIEQTLQAGVAEENKVLEWKLAQKSRSDEPKPAPVQHAKAS